MQNFKGDAIELKMQAVGLPPLNSTIASLDEMYEGAFECSPFLLMLYDSQRMPFSERVKRQAFVDFVKEALKQFPVTGTFEAYLFVLRSIFGELTEIFFEIPDPGKLSIEVNASANLEFDFIGREYISGTDFEFFEMIDYNGDILTFRGIAGIETEYELQLLFSEIMPTGIIPTISLSFYTYYDFVAEDPGPELDNVVDHLNNQIVFYEVGA